MARPTSVEITRDSFDSAEAVALREALAADIAERYGRPDTEPGDKPTGTDLLVFLVARVDGTAVGCGALRRIDDHAVEVKRMFVVARERGSGVARAILTALEDEARAAGARRVLLETGSRQDEAIAFYEREGYRRCECWGAYAQSEISLCYGRDL